MAFNKPIPISFAPCTGTGTPRGIPFFALVPKLQLGNPVPEAQASRAATPHESPRSIPPGLHNYMHWNSANVCLLPKLDRWFTVAVMKCGHGSPWTRQRLPGMIARLCREGRRKAGAFGTGFPSGSLGTSEPANLQLGN